MNVKCKFEIDELLIEKQGVLEAIGKYRRLISQQEAELRILKKRMGLYEERLVSLGKKIESALGCALSAIRGWDVRS